MLGYFSEAYDYMGLDEAEIRAVIDCVMDIKPSAILETTVSDARRGAKAVFNAIMRQYTPTKAYDVTNEKYAGHKLGISISVDLQSSPVFVFKLSSAESITITDANGNVLYEGVGKGTEHQFKIANVHQFCDVFYIETNLSEGPQAYSFTNYAFSTQSIITVREITDAMTKYVEAAKTYAGKP